ncbi:MAG: hypothetical protein MK207_07495 [Saprospiraceae bacterium]|nr:hypothetical protein [Saprospiraceae bacterium]
MNSRKNVIVLDILVHLGFLVWGIMAYIYFQERLYADAGFFVAKVIHYETFWIELNRYARVFSQWLPLIAIKSGASLKTVLILFSLCPVIFFYTIFVISRYWLKNQQVGWMLLSMCTIGISFGFATQGFELYYCAALLLVLHVLLQRPTFSLRAKLLLASITIFIVVNYQLIIVLIAGVLCINYFINRTVSIKTISAIMSLSLATICIKFLLVEHSYESKKAAYVINNIVEWNYDMNYLKDLLSFLIKYYIELIVVMLGTVFYYLIGKRWRWLLGFLIFFILGILIAIVTFPQLEHTRYQEQCYFFLIYISCFPMVMDIMRSFKGKVKMFLHIILFGLVIYRFSVINYSMELFTKRVDFMHRLINYAQTTEGNKFILNEANARTIVVYPFFSFAMETLLLSGLYPKQKSVSVILDNYITYGENERKLRNENLYVSTSRSFYNRPDSLLKHNSVNKRYFDFPSGKYYKLNGSVPNNTVLDFEKRTIELKASTIEKLNASESGDLKIVITNNSHVPLNSEQLRIGYRWVEEGSVIPMDWVGYLNPLEIDLFPSNHYEQTIRVHMPKQAGEYDLKIIAFLNVKGVSHTINNTSLKVIVEK